MTRGRQAALATLGILIVAALGVLVAAPPAVSPEGARGASPEDLMAIVPSPVAATGTIAGTVRLTVRPAAPKMLAITTDGSHCGKEVASEALVVTTEGLVANAIVALVKPPQGPRKMPAGPFVIDQVKCRFIPHVLLVPVGEGIEVHNSDPVLHNFHTRGKANPPRNKAQPPRAAPLRYRPDAAEVIRVECDVHYWMTCWIVAMEHPYYAMTDAQGRFQMDGVPAGRHRLALWHEVYGITGTRQIEVGVGATLEVALELGEPPAPRPSN